MNSLDEVLKIHPTSDEVRRVLVSLFERLDEGVVPRRANASHGTWRPLPNCCFDNVDYFTRVDPRYKRVDGFVFMDFRSFIPSLVRFVPHCVLGAPDGRLVDITPHEADQDYPFIQHVGTPEEFLAVQSQQVEGIGLDLVLR